MRPALSRSLILLALVAMFAALVATHTGAAVPVERSATIDVTFHSELAARISGPSTNLSNGITFDHAVWQDPIRMVGEPDIVIDKQDGIYVSGPGGSTTQASWFWKSTDDAMQWHLIGCPLKSNCQNGGGDTEITTANNGDVFASDLQSLTCNSALRSYDAGATWLTSEGCFPGTDRQWMGVYDPNNGPLGRRVYLSANGTAVGCYFLVSTDNPSTPAREDGLTYVPTDPVGNPDSGIGGSCNGRFAVNPVNGHIYVPGSGNTKVSLDGGVTWLARPRPALAAGGVGNFSTIVVDTAGNLWMSWTTGQDRVRLAYSTDEGQTWSPTMQVSTGPGSPLGNNPDLRHTVFSWPVAGDPGRVAVIFYGTSNTGNTTVGPGNVNALWNAYVSMSTNAMDPNPTWTQVAADEHPMHRSTICTGGTGCATNQTSGDRSLADFFDVDKDSDGRIYIAYNEGSDLSLVVPAADIYVGKPINAVIRLRTGPSLFAAKGNLLPTPTPANVTITAASVNSGTLSASGTQGLPPGNWAPDPAGDAPFPVIPMPSANHPALDIREASIGDDGTNLTVKLKMTDLSALDDALTAGGTPSWMVTWFQAKGGVGPTTTSGAPYSHQYMKWLGQSVFEYGTVSSINAPGLGAPQPKTLTYAPSGTATGTVTGNVVTISAPLTAFGLVAGDKLDQILAYSNVEHADVTVNDWADQVKSFSYLVGTPAASQHLSDGYVEVSMSPDFSGPSSVATLNPNNDTWTATIANSPNCGTVYARQVLSKTLYTFGALIAEGPSWDDVQAGPVATFQLCPTAVTVRSFVARRSGRAVVLRWRTASETQTLGYNLYRQRVKLNKRLIPSVGSSGGHTYVWRDRLPGKAPRYTLEAVRRDGSTVRLGRIAVSRS
jgi:hypothetical protein